MPSSMVIEIVFLSFSRQHFPLCRRGKRASWLAFIVRTFSLSCFLKGGKLSFSFKALQFSKRSQNRKPTEWCEISYTLPRVDCGAFECARSVGAFWATTARGGWTAVFQYNERRPSLPNGGRNISLLSDGPGYDGRFPSWHLVPEFPPRCLPERPGTFSLGLPRWSLLFSAMCLHFRGACRLSLQRSRFRCWGFRVSVLHLSLYSWLWERTSPKNKRDM